MFIALAASHIISQVQIVGHNLKATGVINMTVQSYKEGLKGLVKQLGEMLPEDKLAIFDHDAKQLGKSYPAPLKLGKGDKAPLFSLPNAAGESIDLEKLLKNGKVVLTFYRGVWCPYCNLQLKMYQEILAEIKAAGAQLIAISPMNPDSSVQMKETNELKFEVLSDTGSKIASKYTTVFENPQTSIKAMSELGYDFHSFYDDNSAQLPVPATFVIDEEGIILFAESAGGDYRERVEPQQILEALSK